MLGDNLHQPNLTQQLFSDWLNPSTGRRSRALSKAFAEQYQEQQSPKNTNSIGANMLQNLFNIADVKVQQDFHAEFAYGKTMQIWRKGKLKSVDIFIDPALPTLLWISSKTKAFLFDLTYTNVNRFDLQLEKSSKIKDYIVLHYFQQSLPIIFRGDNAKQANKYFKLFSDYANYNKIISVYPPYFSRIMKLYTMEAIKDDVSRKKKTSDVLKVSQLIGLTDKNRNWKILQAVVSKSSSQTLGENSLINDDCIGEYFKIVHCCEQMKPIFQKYANTKVSSHNDYLSALMTKQSFRQFLMFEQRDQENLVVEILEATKQKISFYDFCCYLLSEKSNYVVTPEQIDENLPLTDYFCYSSHNTYLSGNQLTSDSKIERYIEDLEGGLKCVEIDVHNDGHRPIITHAVKDKSLCKPIDFEETIKAISQFCHHHPNHYPIVISVQNHASDTNRYKMLYILLGAFDKKLLIINNEDPKKSIKICKTLKELRGKIIIKTDSNVNQIYPFRQDMIDNSPVKCQQSSFTIPFYSIQSKFRDSDFQNQYNSFQNYQTQFQSRKGNFLSNNPKELYIPLAEMTKITGMFKSHTGVHNQQSIGYECTSLTSEKAYKQQYNFIVRYTKRSWLRIYPLGTEIASSNYNPIPVLKIGAQIIALNTQTKDNYAWLMMSYFTAGRPMTPGSIGYIQKPLHLRSNTLVNIQKFITVKVISSHEKITIKFYGTDEDMKVNANSTNDFQVKHFNQAFLMFEIGSKFKQCVAIRFIRKGYRVLIAKNEMFRDSGVRNLILVTIKDIMLY